MDKMVLGGKGKKYNLSVEINAINKGMIFRPVHEYGFYTWKCPCIHPEYRKCLPQSNIPAKSTDFV
jgi:hypothetical protein